jgi:hypothetical protein
VDKGWEDNYMKTKWMHLIAGFTMFVLCISICTTTANAAIIWEDNFNDGILDGWTQYAYDNQTTPVLIEGNFSAADYTLKVLDDDINIARHESDTNVGTWSFDMFIPDDDHGTCYFEFMSNGSSWAAGHTNASMVAVGPWLQRDGVDRFIVWRWKYGLMGSNWRIFANIYDVPLHGWHHIDVSRTSDGHFYVWFNGTLKADFVENVVTSSTHLQVQCYDMTGAAIDNIVVNDTPRPQEIEHTNTSPTETTPTSTTPPTTPPPPIDLIPLAIGVSGAVVIIAVLVIILRRR